MKVLDGRNPNKVPTIIEIDGFKDLNIIRTYSGLDINHKQIYIFCVYINGEYTVMTSATLNEPDFQLCKSYKEVRMFDRYIKRFYPNATRLGDKIVQLNYDFLRR